MGKGSSYIEQPLLTRRREPVSLGRYSLRHRLGAGASGTVWSAYDPETEREVALTLMRTLRDPASRDALADRANAWQHVHHANVARVHEAGVFLDPRDETGRMVGVFVVRELVSGVSLQRWLDNLPLGAASKSPILSAFGALGRALAAVHAQGLVHRDVCPASAIMGYDNRVRLIDFGATDCVPVSPDDGDESPRYPAPELQSGAPANARSDQYSFCAALQAALDAHGVRIGRRLRDLLDRGLSPDPTARFDSMDDLVRALVRSRSGWYRAVSTVLGHRLAA